MPEELPQPNEWEGLFRFAERLLGVDVPRYVAVPLGALILVAIVVIVIAAIFLATAKIKEIWREKLRPLTYSPEVRQRIRTKRLFANHVLREINARNLAENWKDEEFAELEAEVEVEGGRRSLIPFSSLLRPAGGVRREPSLTRALERSVERLILLEGDPGSGKSVALRHVATTGGIYLFRQYLLQLPAYALPTTLVALSAVSAARPICQFVADINRFRRWCKETAHGLNANDLVSAYSAFATGYWKLRFLHHVRVHALLVPSAEMEGALRRLIVELGVRHSHEARSIPFRFVSAWVSALRVFSGFLDIALAYDREQRDELYLLLEESVRPRILDSQLQV